MLEREFGIRPAFDKRNADPSKNYGIHGAEMFFYVKGPDGAIQFVIYTQWHLPNEHQELVANCTGRHCSMEPMAADIGYHSPKPMYDGQGLKPHAGNTGTSA